MTCGVGGWTTGRDDESKLSGGWAEVKGAEMVNVEARVVEEKGVRSGGVVEDCDSLQNRR